jgi:ssRNA-specific RNase YbeY (16S rRNA maturation enzyme)
VGNAAMRKSYQDAFGVSKTTDILSWAPEEVRKLFSTHQLPLFSSQYIHGSKDKRDGPSTAPMIICPDYIQKRLVIDQEYHEVSRESKLFPW